MVLLLLLGSHYLWSASHFAGILLPVKTYFLGWDDGFLYFPPAEVLSSTDAESTPVLFGGTSTLASAGAVAGNEYHRLARQEVSFWQAIVARAWFFGYFVLLALAAARTRRQLLLWPLLVLAIFIVSCGWSAALFRRSPAFFRVDQAVALKANHTLRYELQLGPRFMETLRDHGRNDDSLIFFLRSPTEDQRHLAVSVQVGDERLQVEHAKIGKFFVRDQSIEEVLLLFEKHAKVTVEIKNIEGEDSWLIGWQHNGLPGRRCTYLTAAANDPTPRVLPVLEIRLERPDGSIKVAGF